jgi:glutamate-ammonia-ligase adenylyltransferase
MTLSGHAVSSVIADAKIDERLAAARSDRPEQWQRIFDNARVATSLRLVFACSEFVAASCLRDPELLDELVGSTDLFNSCDIETMRSQLHSVAANAQYADPLSALRVFRRCHMVRIAWRDLAGWADLRETLSDLSNLADVCIGFAHDRVYRELIARHGVPYGEHSGEPQALVILGMGKLGGRELNYSSDIDLVFLYPEDGETRVQSASERSVENAEFFLRLGQRIIDLLANKTADGFVYRVDMRLRPFGDSGRMAISFDSFENYLQEHGRDWERYAYVKARPITHIQHRKSLYENVIRPFVYRRYLDFGVFESLRDMKEMIAREVARRDLQDNIKLGPGGIREIEFIVQAFQLIRGGSDRRLQTSELQVALPLLAGEKLLPVEAVTELSAAYEFLRRLENRLQEYNDEQTHRLPDRDTGKSRLAAAMGCSEWNELHAQIGAQRMLVSRHFANVLVGPTDQETPRGDQKELALDATDDEIVARLRAMDFANVDECASQLKSLRDGGYYHRLDENGRRRLNLLLPAILTLLAKQSTPDAALARLFHIFEMIGGRTVYLALLRENGIALQRLVDLCARSRFLAEQIAALPLLLDELIDARLFENVPTRAQFANELAARLESARHEDVELQIEALCHFQRAAMFRIAVADFCGQLPLMKISDRLTDLAELIVNEALTMAWAQIVKRHGAPRCGLNAAALHDARVIVVAYGKFGGIELGYGSDLDLVFLHDSSGEVQMTTGPQVVENTVFFARLGQRLVHLLTTHTRAGRLYEVDIRLRPSGKGGLLVQTLRAFEEYQRKEAWTWEHQALLRARAVAGNQELRATFEQVRIDVLRHSVRRDSLRDEVRKMRERMRGELSKAKSGQFDLKQDAGGIADLEFLTQYWILKWCDAYPPIITFSDNIRQLESLASGVIVRQDIVDFLTATYRKYRQRMHRLSLDGGDDVIADTEFVEERRELIELWNAEIG